MMETRHGPIVINISNGLICLTSTEDFAVVKLTQSDVGHSSLWQRKTFFNILHNAKIEIFC